MPRKAKRKATKMPTVSQRVKQDQTVKINIKNLMPPHMMERSGDYIMPKRGMPTDKNLNMGNQTRLLGPSIQYAVRPPEFLPLPERFNSLGQPSYVREGPARQGRPDLIYTETNPSDIAPGQPSVRAIPSLPSFQVFVPRTPEEVYRDTEAKVRAKMSPQISPGMVAPPAAVSIRAIDSPQMDEAQALVAAQVAPNVSNRTMGQQRRQAFERVARATGSAATTGVPPMPAPAQPPSPMRQMPVLRLPLSKQQLDVLSPTPEETKDED